jgi:DNA polymerase-3 subunit gamma/tau
VENFIVSARKYRPQTFEDVVGQKAITDTLNHAIENNHLAQALLFTGPRGVGKTTCARILAKKINEQKGHSNDSDFYFNIFELDAASNNSVDDIRNLSEQVRVPPQTGSYKVYIIDEVHMLSASAFNAFLKTLEEPPAHAIFILATTEKHKIIPTILSRCQIYDFKRIEVADVKFQLEKICKLENIEAQDEALHMIASLSDGAMRDGLSMFDRVVSFSGKNITVEDVSLNLNILSKDYYFKVVDLALKSDIPNLMLTVNEILNKGFDLHNFISGLATHVRDLLVASDKATRSILEVSEDIKNKLEQQVKVVNPEFIFNTLDILNNADVNFKTSRNQRLLVEMSLMQIASINSLSGVKKKI